MMHKHPFDALTLENGARLIFTPCPGSKEVSLTDTISQFKAANINLLLTLMFDEDMAANQISSLPELCQTHMIDWIQLPIVDDEAPSEAFETLWQKHKLQILSVLEQGGSIAVHCKGGTGRTGLVIALILLAYGWCHDDVKQAVQTIRPKSLQHKAQLAYFLAH